ncbi:MAG: type I-B CRISPR-associated endonuclease Cas1b [Armatimonadetes bacterium]|nr:type I-B CRISPR-associated endonuclease Cas1b [Armatimonadota bacterium]MDW8121935.1 type I-B CRISPR-associated endonuclease Cas1b [Armatimonadota bacterium]
MAKSYYIFKSGRLKRKQNTIYIEYLGDDQQEQRIPIPIEDVRDLFLFSEVDLNTKLLTFLAQHGIVVHFFNYYGYYSGSFYPRETNVSGHLLVRQVEHYLEKEKRMTLAKAFVEGSLHHMRRNLNYYHKRGKDLEKAISLLDSLIDQIPSCQDLSELLSIEGRGRDCYYQTFNDFLSLEEPFIKRVRRPPDNMINCLLSFGNSLLYTAVLSEIYVTQLNPTISYLHEPSEKRFSLCLDIAEIFKPLIVDRTIFRVINKNMISDEDFEDIGEAPGVYIKESARKNFVKEMEETLQTTVRHRQLNRNVSYRQLIRLEGYRLIRHLLGMEPYKPLKAWW